MTGLRRSCAGLGLAVLAGVAMAVPTPTLAQPGCGNVALRSPYRGEVVQGAVAILGSARIERFQFYKLEWAPVDDGERWSAVSDTVDQPMVNGLLDMWDTTGLPDGAYRLKLTVVDTDYQERCRVTVENVVVANIGTPAATETPTATVTPEPSAAPTDMPTDMPTDAPAEITAGAPDAAATAVERAGDDGGEAAGSAPTLQPVAMEPLDAPADTGLGIGALAAAFATGFAGALGLAAVAWYALARK